MGVALRRIAFTHAGCLTVLWTCVSGAALATCAVTYAARHGLTAGQLDLNWLALRALAAAGLIRDLNEPRER